MSRREKRIRQAMEKNPIQECNKVQSRFCPELFRRFAETEDVRHQSYTSYTNKALLGTLYYKGIGGIVSMQMMDEAFNHEKVVGNIRRFLGEVEGEYLPHSVTLNEYLERLEPEELEKVIQDEVYSLIRRKSFDGAKYRKRWLVIVDGTQLYSGNRKINEKCLERHYKKEGERERVNYHSDVLEAKIVLGENLLASIGSEFIENNAEDAQRQEGMSEEERKQDCETKAFIRLAGKIKKRFPRLPVTLLVDSLYASEPVMELCHGNGWDYIIRYKSGKIPSIAQEYGQIPEKGRSGHAEYVNEIDYRGKPVNMLRFYEEKKKGKEVVRTEFQWLTNIRITDKNAEKIAETGRKRWKIENHGFNRQKNWQGDITHACSWNEKAMKNHYLMEQISDMIKQLYEWFCLKKEGIKKKQKNISSELLESFGWPLTETEDIFEGDMLSIPQN